jgi:ribulose-phosphate 3-epimerase
LICSTKSYIAEVDSVARYVKESVIRLCAENGIRYDEITACGVGIPGTVSEDGKKIIKAPNISVLSPNLAEELEDVLGVPVSLVQDSRAAAYGEHVASGEEYKCLVCVTLGTGIGTGIVLNGEIFGGALGAAGELGHLPVAKGERACGCGKRGCLEKYCAGGGLDITAKEILGEGNSAKDLFAAMREGNGEAKDAISKAVDLLGERLVSIVNLLSPDCLVFSGGLSSEELYLEPLIRYIEEHCYSAGRLPVIKKAVLSENSPLYGAAFMPMTEKRKKAMLSASVMCADLLNLGMALREIEESGIEYLHCDIMDNHFVPNLMLPMEMLNKLRSATSLPFDFHLMTEKPETVIERLDVRAGDIISVHYESTYHIEKVVSMIKERGALAAVAINPGTPIYVLEELLPKLDMVLLMTVNPGFAGQKLVPGSFDKIARLKSYLSDSGYGNILIEVDGNCSFENVPKMYGAGADIFVVGTSSVFKDGLTVKEGATKLRLTLG